MSCTKRDSEYQRLTETCFLPSRGFLSHNPQLSREAQVTTYCTDMHISCILKFLGKKEEMEKRLTANHPPSLHKDRSPTATFKPTSGSHSSFFLHSKLMSNFIQKYVFTITYSEIRRHLPHSLVQNEQDDHEFRVPGTQSEQKEVQKSTPSALDAFQDPSRHLSYRQYQTLHRMFFPKQTRL